MPLSLSLSHYPHVQISAEMRAKNNAELQRTNHSRMLNCFDPSEHTHACHQSETALPIHMHTRSQWTFSLFLSQVFKPDHGSLALADINIARDARWGRVQETYGEDPHLTGTIAAHFVQGLQSGNDQFYKVVGILCSYCALTVASLLPTVCAQRAC